MTAAESSPGADVEYRPDIDGLRALAVLAVLGFHAFPDALRSGFIGVDVFFVVSGFLITSIIVRRLEDGRFQFAWFFARRIRRLFPALILVVASCMSVGWFALLADEYAHLGKHVAAGAGFVSNFVLWQESGYFDGPAATKLLLHLWSLGIEEQFYVVWPLLLWVAWARGVNPLALTVVLGLASFGLNIAWRHVHPVADFFSPQTRAWELLAGAMLAQAIHAGALGTRMGGVVEGLRRYIGPAGAESVRRTASFAGALLIALGLMVISRERSFPGFWAALPVAGTALIIAAGPRAWLNRELLSNPGLVWVGRISYPLYLWHWPLLALCRIVEGETPDVAIRLGALGLSVVLAALTYVLVERPIRKNGRAETWAIGLACSMAACGIAGFGIYQTNGVESRAIVRETNGYRNELIRTAQVDAECGAMTAAAAQSFAYCRRAGPAGAGMVAVIGDSHAHVAFTGIAGVLERAGVGAVLIANSGCPPFLGSEYGQSDREREECRRRIADLIEVVIRASDIKHVFIFSRGAIYITGKGFGEAERSFDGPPRIPGPVFKASLQRTVDALVQAGKRVYYVLENPELGRTPDACIPRPFRTTVRSCDIERRVVLDRQAEYLSIVASLKGATVIPTIPTFCDDRVCKPFAADGRLLYADDDHLSVAGSYLQATAVLGPYLSEIAAEIDGSRARSEKRK